MDPDVKGQFVRLGALLEQSVQRQDSLERLVMDVKESLEREVGDLRHEVQQGFLQVNTRLDTQAACLECHAGFWQAGTR
jgi:hypothetical protein